VPPRPPLRAGDSQSEDLLFAPSAEPDARPHPSKAPEYRRPPYDRRRSWTAPPAARKPSPPSRDCWGNAGRTMSLQDPTRRIPYEVLDQILVHLCGAVDDVSFEAIGGKYPVERGERLDIKAVLPVANQADVFAFRAVNSICNNVFRFRFLARRGVYKLPLEILQQILTYLSPVPLSIRQIAHRSCLSLESFADPPDPDGVNHLRKFVCSSILSRSSLNILPFSMIRPVPRSLTPELRCSAAKWL
jgi:hypothetical protein